MYVACKQISFLEFGKTQSLDPTFATCKKKFNPDDKYYSIYPIIFLITVFIYKYRRFRGDSDEPVATINIFKQITN